jgi:2-polyprenyl-6-methoxyphenol hydroxylase-like FAD-dependent oxidoreductase
MPRYWNSSNVWTPESDADMTEKVVVIGAGIGGLCTALMLQPTGRDILILERDGPIGTDEPDDLFRNWKRTGVGHVRQSHAFLARLRTILKDEHPALLDSLMSHGVRELTFDMMLTEQQQQNYRPQPEDSDLTIITSRRTTLEMVIRRYVESLPNVKVRSGFFVRKLITAKDADGSSPSAASRENGTAHQHPLTQT